MVPSLLKTSPERVPEEYCNNNFTFDKNYTGNLN